MSVLKYITLFFSFLLSISVFAQKVKVKKDLVYIDKKATSLKVETKEELAYEFIDLSNNKTFLKVNYRFKNFSETKNYRWLEISSDESSYVNETDMKFITFSFKIKNSVVEFLMKELEFFDLDGNVNYNEIQSYFSEKRVRESLEVFNKDIELFKGSSERFAQTSELQIRTDPSSQTIERGLNNEGVIGTFYFDDKGDVIVKDLSGNILAIAQYDGFSEVTVNLPLEDRLFSYKRKSLIFSKTSPKDVQNFTTELVRYLHAEGIRLGNEIENKKALVLKQSLEKDKERYKKDLKNSPNIENEKGFIVDEEGNKINGKIYLPYEYILKPGEKESKLTIIGLNDNGAVGLKNSEKTVFGAIAKVTFYENKENKNGKSSTVKRVKSFSANKHLYLKIESGYPKYDGYYLGVTMLKSNSTKKSLYVRVISGNIKEDRLILCKHPIDDSYLLQLKTKPLALKIEENNIEQLYKYLDDCQLLSNENIDIQDLNSLIKLVNFYNNSCK